jgi:hypothetical protein
MQSLGQPDGSFGPHNNSDSAGLPAILRREDPFTAEDINVGRLVWDPAVHQFCANTCSFFLLRFRNVRQDELGFLQNSVGRELDVASYYIYLLFGHFDAILRVWATAAKLGHLRAQIRNWAEKGILLEGREFQSDDSRAIIDGQLQRGPDLRSRSGKELIRKHLMQINTISSALSLGKPLNRPAYITTLEQLVADGLLHVATVGEPCAGLFRFVIVLLPETGAQSPFKLDHIVEWIAEFNRHHQEQMLRRAAVYSGIGYGEFLITGVVATYEALLGFSAYIRAKIGIDARIRTETFLNATKKSIATDRIDPTQTEMDPTEEQLIDFLSSSDPSPSEQASLRRQIAANLSPEQRVEIRTIFQRNQNLLVGHFSDYYRYFLDARVRNSSKSLATALLSTLELEGYLAEVFLAACKQGGNEAFGTVKEAAQLAKVPNFEIKRPTLSGIVDVCNYLKSHDKDDLLSSRIGDGWTLLATGQLRDVRNDMAHGRVSSKPDYVQARWSEIAKLIGTLGTLYNSSVEYHEKQQKLNSHLLETDQI